MAWKRSEEKVTCVSILLYILQDELSLEILSPEDIICDGNYYCFKTANNGNEQSGRVDFDIRKAGVSLEKRIFRLRPTAHRPGNHFLALKEDEG